jgi:hypothetical protein
MNTPRGELDETLKGHLEGNLNRFACVSSPRGDRAVCAELCGAFGGNTARQQSATATPLPRREQEAVGLLIADILRGHFPHRLGLLDGR